MFVVVAEILAGDRDLRTLSNLNTVSRHINEATLPVLYEKVIISTEKAFERCVRFTNPRGWKYVKYVCHQLRLSVHLHYGLCRYLFVSEITLPLLRLHLRFQSQNRLLVTDEPSDFFPRLALLGLMDVKTPFTADREHTLHLTLYKPMRLTSLLEACLPFASDRRGHGISSSFFGTYYFREDGLNRPVPSVTHDFRDIMRLEVRRDAYLTREEGCATTEMEGWHSMSYGTHFELDIGGEADEFGVEDTLRSVIAHLALHTSSQAIIATGKMVSFGLKCSQSVFEKFIEQVSSKARFRPNLSASG